MTPDNSERYPPSPPFQEAGPRSSVWRAYLDEALIYDTDMVKNKRAKVNILLVFAALFSGIVSAFIVQILPDIQTPLQAMSASASRNDNTTSNAESTADTLHKWTYIISYLWVGSLGLSLGAASVAFLIDEWYYHYLSPIAGDPQVCSRIRHLRFNGLLDWHVSMFVHSLPLFLHASLGIFFVGLFIYLF
ncbi:uncharacterized protein EV420DRAFT_1280708, partial [Desarmillaria tabescens]